MSVESSKVEVRCVGMVESSDGGVEVSCVVMVESSDGGVESHRVESR